MKELKGVKGNSITGRVRVNIGQRKKGTGSLGEDKLVNNKAKAKKFNIYCHVLEKTSYHLPCENTEKHVPIGSNIIAYIANSIWNNILNTKP